ncbi:uncharacterized protein LOC117323022 isoform X1 [Pecten maximus]|uniref:uncharacterized protein LOC117323022 isoform X1 n=1 Tax=Pecten maximus TaxID=6579 RepID=UPI001458E2E8|nr:uncharacterized protein LOC117323022 isoform X1 [Pecten maximus]
MKETQDLDLEPKDRRGNKRKSHGIKESKPKMSKVCLDTHQELQSNLSDSKKQTKGVISYKMFQGGKERSPFRKVKSFNDIDHVQSKPTNDLRQSKGRKCLSLRNVDTVTKTVTTASTSKSVGRMTVNQGSSVTSNQATFTSNQVTQSTHALAMDKKQHSNRGNPPAEICTPVDPSASKMLRNVASSSTTHNYNVTSGRSSLSTTNRASTHHSGLVGTCSERPNKVCDKGPSVPVPATNNSLKNQVIISSRTFVVAKTQTTGSGIVSTGVQNPNPVVSKSQFNKINSGLQCSTVQSASTTTSNSRRRSSGIFDTSLSDDLLCQLAEPDELLDSQASQNTNSIVKSQSLGVTLHEGKPVQGVGMTKCVSVSCDRPKSSVLFPASSKGPVKTTGLKQVPIISNFNKTGCANYNIPLTTQSSVSGNNRIGADSMITLSQVSSSQRSKFKFKSKSVNSGMGVQIPVSTVTTKMSANLSTSVSAPEIRKLTTVATKSTGSSLTDNSEDLFNSDDDELSEQQILAVLDTVELEASQMPIAPQSQQCPKTSPSAFPSKCSMNEIEQKKHAAKAKLLKKKAEAVSPETLSQDTSPIKFSPTKYTLEEIERKKQAALEKRRAKSKETLPESSNVFNQYKQDFIVKKQQNVSTKNPSAIQSCSSGSPDKLHQDDIQRKRLAALEKLKLREDNVKKCASSSSSSDRNSFSPGKCSQEEIEQKKLAALERKKHASGDVMKARHHSDSSPGFSSSQSAESSPFKCTPEEIEKKKLAALAKLKIRKNLSSQMSSKGN